MFNGFFVLHSDILYKFQVIIPTNNRKCRELLVFVSLFCCGEERKLSISNIVLVLNETHLSNESENTTKKCL